MQRSSLKWGFGSLLAVVALAAVLLYCDGNAGVLSKIPSFGDLGFDGDAGLSLIVYLLEGYEDDVKQTRNLNELEARLGEAKQV